VLLPFILHSTYFLTRSLGIRRDSRSQLSPSTRPLSILENQVLMLARYEIYVLMDSGKLYFPVFCVLATPCRRTRGECHTKPCHPFSTCHRPASLNAGSEAKYILRSRGASREWLPLLSLLLAAATHLFQCQRKRTHPKLIFSSPKSAFTNVCPSPTPSPTSSSTWTAISRCSPHPSPVQRQYSNQLQTQNNNQSHHSFPRTTTTATFQRPDCRV